VQLGRDVAFAETAQVEHEPFVIQVGDGGGEWSWVEGWLLTGGRGEKAR
jgi:hypothetical protein